MYNCSVASVQFSPTALFSHMRRWCPTTNGQGVQLRRYIQDEYSAIPEHPKPQPLCTETALIVHRHRGHCASKKHAQTDSRRDFSTARAARSAGVACGKVSAAILPAASSMQPHHKQLCLRDHAHPFSHGFLAFNHDPIRIVHAPVAYRIGNQRIPDLVTPTGNIKL